MAHPDSQNQLHDSSSPQEKMIVYCVALAAFTFQFEAFLVNVALPDMARELQATSTLTSFIIITYLLAATASFLPVGRLGERYGLKRIFLYGCVLASIGTLACGFSINLPMLWASRFLQGIGTGAMVATGYAMIPSWVRKEKVGWGYGMLSLGAGLGMIAGLPIGGILSQYFEWPWIFLSTFPLFVFLFWFGKNHLPSFGTNASQPTLENRLDWFGLFLSVLMISTFVLAISLGAELGWKSKPILFLLMTSLILFGWLYLRAKSGKSILSAALINCQGFLPALLTLFVYQFVNSGVRFLAPFYLELSVGLTALLSSILMLAYPIGFAPAGICAGRLADRIGPYPIVISSLCMSTVVCTVYTNLFETRAIWTFVIFMFILGIASAMFSPANNRTIMSDVPETQRSEAGALLPIALNLGSLLGVSVFDTIFSLNFPIEPIAVLQKSVDLNSAQMILTEGFRRSFSLASLILPLVTIFALLIHRSASR